MNNNPIYNESIYIVMELSRNEFSRELAFPIFHGAFKTYNHALRFINSNRLLDAQIHRCPLNPNWETSRERFGDSLSYFS